MTMTTTTSSTPFQLMEELIKLSCVSINSTTRIYNQDGSHNHSDSINSSHNTNALQQQLDDVLRAADVLYPPKLLQGALTILDEAAVSITTTTPTTTSNHSTASTRYKIRKLLAVPSQRQVYLIQSSSIQQQLPYVCIFPDEETAKDKEEDASSLLLSSSNSASRMYCSCRSFWENANSDQSPTSLPTICQHLLALQLLPLVTTMTTMIAQEEEQQQQTSLSTTATTTTTTTTATTTTTKAMSGPVFVETIPDQDFCQHVLPFMYSWMEDTTTT